MPDLDYNTYISLLIGSILIEFVGVFLKLITDGKSISPKKKALAVYFSIIVYGIIAFMLTVLYKKISISDFVDFLKAFKRSGEYIHENVLNHWYNFFFPWINNNATKSIFDSTTLICLWTIVSMIFITPVITVIIYFFIDVYKVYNNGSYDLLDKEIARFKLFFALIAIALAAPIPMTIFYFYNTFYIAFDYSNQATIIFIVSVTVILSFLIIGGFVINEMSDISHNEK